MSYLNAKIPPWLLLLWVGTGVAAVVWKLRQPPIPDQADPSPTALTPPQSAPTPPALPGPRSLAETRPQLARCYAQHGEAEGLPTALTVVFTVAVDPTAAQRVARIARLRVRGENDTVGDTASPFEACAERALASLVLLAPGGRDSIDIPMPFTLAD